VLWRGAEKNMEEQAKYQTKMDEAMTEVYDTPTTVAEQKILNARLRLALRTGNLPFQFIDSQEKHYRKIVYAIGVEVGKKFTANKDGNVWTVKEVEK
jgi:hypothetical protein